MRGWLATGLMVVALAGCATSADDDVRAFQESDARNSRCDAAWGTLTKPYVIDIRSEADLAVLADRMRADGSPLHEVLSVPEDLVRGALNGDAAKRLAMFNAMQRNADRIMSDKDWCVSTMFDSLVPMLVRNNIPKPGTQIADAFERRQARDLEFYWFQFFRLVEFSSTQTSAAGESR